MSEVADMFKAMLDAEKRDQLKREEQSKSVQILVPEEIGYSRNGNNEQVFVIRLSGIGKPPNLKYSVYIEEEYINNFTKYFQPFEVEFDNYFNRNIEERKAALEKTRDAIIWINSQIPNTKWSLTQEIHATYGITDKTITYFSFDTAEAATLFKMFQT